MLSPQARGVWIDMLCFMWRQEDRGKIEGLYTQLSRLLSCTEQELKESLEELSVTKVADVTVRNDFVTVINRRMYREENTRKLTRCRVQRFRNGEEKQHCNADVTHPSSSSSSSSSSLKEKKPRKPSADTPKKGVSPHTDFIAYAFESFQSKFGEKMLIDGGKDGKIVKDLLSAYGLDRLKNLWNVFMQSDDPYIEQAGRSIGVFKSQINKLLSGGNGNGNRPGTTGGAGKSFEKAAGNGNLRSGETDEYYRDYPLDHEFN